MNNTSKKATLVDIIYSEIKKDVTQHILLPGEKINIKELSERYQASQTPIKLALNRLISEKIVENFPRQGMFIHAAQPEEIEEIFDIRQMLDLYFTKEIITTINFNKKLRDQLRANIDEHLKVVSDLKSDSPIDTFLKNYELDSQFHELYLKCSGNRKILDIFHSINPFLYSNYIFRKQSKEKDISGVYEHEAILNAILSEDEDLLKQAVITHNRNAKTAVSLILKVDKIL